MSSVSRPVRAGGAVLVAALLLSGCAGLRPGTAVEVGEEQITAGELDSIATRYCSAATASLDEQAQSIPNSYLRSGIAGLLAMREVATQVAAEQGVEVQTDAYQQQLGDVREQVADLPESQQEAVLDVEGARIFTAAAQTAIGREVLGPDAEDSELQAAGAEEMQRWIDEHGVEFAPGLNVTMRDGQPAPADGSLSFAVSDEAKAGQAEQPSAAAGAALPDSQRCGR